MAVETQAPATVLPMRGTEDHEAGDHTLYLGLVESLSSRPGEPLLFHRGAFGRVSPHEPDLEQTWGW